LAIKFILQITRAQFEKGSDIRNSLAYVSQPQYNANSISQPYVRAWLQT
jgi:hypothetical protein